MDRTCVYRDAEPVNERAHEGGGCGEEEEMKDQEARDFASRNFMEISSIKDALGSDYRRHPVSARLAYLEREASDLRSTVKALLNYLGVYAEPGPAKQIEKLR